MNLSKKALSLVLSLVILVGTVLTVAVVSVSANNAVAGSAVVVDCETCETGETGETDETPGDVETPTDPSEGDVVKVYGDANGDGRVSVADARHLVNLLAQEGGLSSLSALELKAIDVNKDGRGSVADVRLIVLAIARGEEDKLGQ